MLTAAQERQELLNFMRRALTHFDQVSERPNGTLPDVSAAQLFFEGKVCLMRLDRERDDR